MDAFPVRVRRLFRLLGLLAALPLALGILLWRPGTAQAAESSAPYEMVFKPAPDLPGLQEKISLELRDTNVGDVFRYLGEKSSTNVVVGPGVEGRVTLFLKDITIENALQILLLSYNLACRRHGSILYIMKEEEYAALYGEAYRDQRIVRIIPLKYANPALTATFLGNVKSTVGKIVVDDGTATLVLMDVPEKVALMEEVVSKLDIPSVVRQVPLKTEVFDLRYAKASDIQGEVAKALTPAGTLRADGKSNTLIVSDVEVQMPRVEQVIRAFDRKLRQVFIETKMIQVRLEDRYFMGVEWETLFPDKRGHGGIHDFNLKGSFPISSSATTFGKIVLGSLTRDNYTFLVQALHKFGDTETLAGPQLAAVSGEEANILIGTREAYVTSTVSQAQSTTTTSEDITFIDVGVKLKIKPEVNDEGFVKLTLTPEVSSVGRTLTTANKNEIPIVDTTTTTTTVLVKDGYTVLIGGLIKDEIVTTKNKIPLLGDVPYIGNLFRNTDNKRIKTELVVLITPHIISGDEETPFLTGSGKPFGTLRDLPRKEIDRLRRGRRKTAR